MNLNNIVFHIGIVKNTEQEFKVKVGLTKDLCDFSKTLSFTKIPPFANKCNYKSLGMFQSTIVNTLEKHNFQNLGNDEQTDDVVYYMQHRFNLNTPILPLTRL